jgi:hypothetical protein
MIYFIRCSATNMVKIGFAADPWKRLSKIQSDTPSAVELLAVEEGDTKRERALHRQFKDDWRRGEWFNYGPALQAYVETLPAPIKARVGKRLGGTLGAWLYDNRLTLRAFAVLIDSDKATISQICAGNTIPRKALMQRIYVATHGAVQPNDFYDLPRLSIEVAA